MMMTQATKLTARFAILIAGLATLPANAEWSANAGWVSEYIFRGVPQKTSSASAGLDFAHGGFYAGTWGADVGDGLEIDAYLGYSFDFDEFALSIGSTGYFYTGDFDDTYKELNFGAEFGIVALDVAVGDYENFAGPSLDYTHAAATVGYNGFHGTIGNFSQDFEGTYLDVGYSFEVAGEVDVKISWIYADKDLALNPDPSTGAPRDDHTVVFGVSKSFSIAP